MGSADRASEIVADGRERCLASPEFHRRREDLVRSVWQSYAERLNGASLPARVALHVRARLEIRRRLRELVDELAPQQGHF